MNITFEEADKIRAALRPGADQETRYQAIAILDVAEQKQREKNARTVSYILEKRKSDKSYARPKKTEEITVSFNGQKLLCEGFDMNLIEKLEPPKNK